MHQRKNIEVSIKPHKILLIGHKSSASSVICDYLRTLGCNCTIASNREALARIEREAFDAVLFDLTHESLPEQTVLAIKEIRPNLAKRILLITGGSQSTEMRAWHDLSTISKEKPLSQLWAKLELIFAGQQPPRFAPAGMQKARLIFDSFSSPAISGIRGSLSSARQLAYQHRSTTVNLLVQHNKETVWTSLAGQVLDVSMRAVHGLPVLLSSRNRTLAQTITSQFGEFGLEVDLVEYAGLQIRLAEGSWIYMALEDTDLNQMSGLEADR
jgi:CheY-like chemotaxis protein